MKVIGWFYISSEIIEEVDCFTEQNVIFKVTRQVPELWSGVKPHQLVYPSRGQGGEEATAPASYWA